MKKGQRGFTLIEVIMVVVLISILGAIVIPRFFISTKQAKVQACEIQRAIINKQVESYYFIEATWPMDSLTDIKSNANYFPDGIPTCPIDETSYILKPSPIHRVSGHREGSGTHIWTEYLRRP
ncbi:MAG TPA: type II secretion system protein [bacterium]|nr:type II secretion system protein [bacterium]